MKKKNKKYGKRIVAGLLVAIILLLETTAIFATEINATKPEIVSENIVTKENIDSVMSEQFRFTLNDDFVTFPTTVPELIASSNRIYEYISPEISAKCIATYRSNDDLFTVTFENTTDKTIDMNKAIVRSISITPQTGTVLKISGLTMDNKTSVSEIDLIKIFGDYSKDTSYILDEHSTLYSWDFETYSISVTLKDNCIFEILVTSKESTLPKVSKDLFYNFESGDYYKIEVFEVKPNYGASLATTFYVTGQEKANMKERLFFDLYTTNTYSMGYLLQNESIDALNTNNDYEAVLADLSEKMELEYYSQNATFITKTDYEIEQENNVRYIVTSIVLTLGIVVLIVCEKRNKRKKMKHELQHQKEERNKLSGTTGDEE